MNSKQRIHASQYRRPGESTSRFRSYSMSILLCVCPCCPADWKLDEEYLASGCCQNITGASLTLGRVLNVIACSWPLSLACFLHVFLLARGSLMGQLEAL
jgi:hypothetical protein